MRKLAKPTWLYILEASQEFNGKPFTPNDLVNRVKELAPRAKRNTIICNLHGMTPNHPSSKTFPSILKNHPAFRYVGKDQFQILQKENSKT